jgi:plasmid segregation protein ParM
MCHCRVSARADILRMVFARTGVWPCRGLALEHKQLRLTAAKQNGFAHLSRRWRWEISGMLRCRLCTASVPGVHCSARGRGPNIACDELVYPQCIFCDRESWMTVIGLDVGYSNLKIAVGESGTAPQVMVRPAGAAPLDRLGERIGAGLPQDVVIVDVDGQRWAAAVEPARLGGWQRSLHADYAATPAYWALVTAALVLADRPVVERLVTGLPVDQARDPRRREALRRALIGHHDTESGGVEVRDVRIVPQPVGAFIDLLWSDLEAETLARLEEGTVLVLDAGYYSFDWAIVVARELRRGASGTSLEAMSVLLERAAGLIAEQHGGRPQPLALEAALRRGREHLLVLGKRVSLQAALERAAVEVGGIALEALRQALRREVTNVDLVLETGGGGALFGRQAAELFSGAEVRLARDPVGANARGFFRYGQR